MRADLLYWRPWKERAIDSPVDKQSIVTLPLQASPNAGLGSTGREFEVPGAKSLDEMIMTPPAIPCGSLCLCTASRLYWTPGTYLMDRRQR